ncbi:hypothetical protein IID19_03995 [Patescibacteria group bacterium]|nr:hypothetical protein [Patescibacteria group bacterium]
MKQVKFTTLFVLFIISSILMSACTIPALGVERGRRGSPLFDIRLSTNGVSKIYGDFIPIRSKTFYYFTVVADQPRGNATGVWNLSRATWRINAGREQKFNLKRKRNGSIRFAKVRNLHNNTEVTLYITGYWTRTYIVIDEHGIPETHTEDFGPVYQYYYLKFYR